MMITMGFKPTEKKRLEFILDEDRKRPKTEVYMVKVHGEIPLGTIYWKNIWRQYVFETQLDLNFNSPFFSASCLKEIHDFIEVKMQEHKNKLARKRNLQRKENEAMI
jgi:hypothetical protein